MEVQEPINYHFGHADGHTSICYSTDGRWILTCGSDGDVRIWSGKDDEDADSQCAGETAYAVAFNKDRFYVAIDNGLVQIFTFPEYKRDGIVCRFTAPVTHIAVSKNGDKIAACSCDMDIRVVDLENNGEIVLLSGHAAPVTSVDFDPKTVYLASSSCDGSVKIWNVATGTVVKTFSDLLPKCNDFFRAVVLGRPSWDENSLAIPCGKEVTVYERDSWTEKFKLSDPSIVSVLSLSGFSPCGKYLAASSTSGELIIWDIATTKKVNYYAHGEKSSISGFAWHPDGNSIAVCNRRGQYGILCDLFAHYNVEEAMPSPLQHSDLAGDESDDENAISLEEIKRTSGWVAPDDMDDANSVSNDGPVCRKDDVFRSMSASLALQPAFQPSSTPVHFQHRFMLWNSIGIVRCFNTEEEKSIDIEFHDSLFHHALHLNNYDEYTMAALSEKIIATASQGGATSDESQSKLTCVHLNAWDGAKEWNMIMPEGENIVAIAAASNWVAVATDSHYLRIFSFAGTQRQLLSLPGPVVCLCGHDEQLCVVYHQGIGAADSQNLGVTVYDLQSILLRTKVPPQPLPLPPCSTLKWMGFSDEGRLCAFDSVGIMRTLSHDFLHWLIIADTRLQAKGLSDHYFIVGLSERYQNIRCILCKGGYYPMTTPRPTVVEIPLKIPLCKPEAEKSVLEESFWRLMSCLPGLDILSQKNEDYIADVAEKEKTLKQTIIKLFANACRANADLRATDVASFMPDAALQMAAKYASKSGKLYLSEKLGAIQPVEWSDAWTATQAFYATPCQQPNNVPYNQGLRIDENVEASQKDMFADTPMDSNKLLLAEREYQDMDNNMDSPISVSTTHRNPFKTKSKIESGQGKGLSYFDKPILAKAPKSLPQSFPPKKKVGKGKKDANETENTRKKQTFVDWYNEHKTRLQGEFPLASPSELTKLGMNQFRQMMTKNSEDTANATTEPSIAEGQKRKLDECDNFPAHENVKKVASSKLSAFAFNSK